MSRQVGGMPVTEHDCQVVCADGTPRKSLRRERWSVRCSGP